MNCQYLSCRSLLLVPSQNAAVLRQWELNQHVCCCTIFFRFWRREVGVWGAVGAEGAQGIRLTSPSLIILSVTQFTTRHSLIKIKVVVEEADLIHPNSRDPHLRWYMAEQEKILYFPSNTSLTCSHPNQHDRSSSSGKQPHQLEVIHFSDLQCWKTASLSCHACNVASHGYSTHQAV